MQDNSLEEMCVDLDRKPEDAVKKEGGEPFLLKLQPSFRALFALQPCHAHVEDDDHPGGEDELVKEQLLGDNGTRCAGKPSVKPRVPSCEEWREHEGSHYSVTLYTGDVKTV